MVETQMETLKSLMTKKETECAENAIKLFNGLTVSEAHSVLDYLKLKVNCLGTITL